MSESTDDTLNRYLAQQPGMREALLTDPVQHMQAEALRRTLAMVERALIDEGLPDDVRRRVVNRVVWGESEGFVDRHARVREWKPGDTVGPLDFGITPAAPNPLSEAMRRNLAHTAEEMLAPAKDDSAGPARPDEEPTR